MHDLTLSLETFNRFKIACEMSARSHWRSAAESARDRGEECPHIHYYAAFADLMERAPELARALARNPTPLEPDAIAEAFIAVGKDYLDRMGNWPVNADECDRQDRIGRFEAYKAAGELLRGLIEKTRKETIQ